MSILQEKAENGFVVWGPWVFYLCDRSPVPHEKAEKRNMGGGLFCPIFRNHYF